MTALIGLIGVALGSLLTGLFTWLTSRTQSKDEIERAATRLRAEAADAHDRWLREERLASYLGFLRVADKHVQLLKGGSTLLVDDDSYVEVRNAAAAVVILASQPVRSAVAPFSIAVGQLLARDSVEQRNKVDELRYVYIATIQRDLGIPVTEKVL